MTTTTTTIKCSQQLSQLVLNTAWLPAAYCHGETGAINSVLGLGWTSIWESCGGKEGSWASCARAQTTKPLTLVAIKKEERQNPPTQSICRSWSRRPRQRKEEQILLEAWLPASPSALWGWITRQRFQ